MYARYRGHDHHPNCVHNSHDITSCTYWKSRLDHAFECFQFLHTFRVCVHVIVLQFFWQVVQCFTEHKHRYRVKIEKLITILCILLGRKIVKKTPRLITFLSKFLLATTKTSLPTSLFIRNWFIRNWYKDGQNLKKL